MVKKLEIAYFAAGCFWGIEEAFRTTKGVLSTKVGYTGGHTKNPSYKEVCTDTTGHAEAVQVTFDPKTVTFTQLLNLFWSLHDPTTMNRQGPDIGSQYRSAIFYVTEVQKEQALKSKEIAQKKFKKPIVTEIVKASDFYDAEEYHQQYLKKNGGATCHF